MKARTRVSSFNPQSLKLAAVASEVARVTGQDITVDLFSPRRRCTRCAHKADVFIGPRNVCASCWVELVARYAGESERELRAELPAITAALASPSAA
jgi:hypothetical protein